MKRLIQNCLIYERLYKPLYQPIYEPARVPAPEPVQPVLHLQVGRRVEEVRISEVTF